MKHIHAFHFEYVPVWWLRNTWHAIILTNAHAQRCPEDPFAVAVWKALLISPTQYRKARW